jgi:hypothetical protein
VAHADETVCRHLAGFAQSRGTCAA